MTRLPLLPLALLVSGASATAQGWDETGPWYVGFGVGIPSISESEGFEPDEGFAVSGTIGYQLGRSGDGRFNLALEAEYYYAENDVDDFPIAFGLTAEDLETNAIFANLVGDWYWTDSISFYVGAGVGFAEVDLFSASDDGGAFQGKAGLRYHLGGGFSWSLGYRYLMTEDIEDADDFENIHNVVETGLRWEL